MYFSFYKLQKKGDHLPVRDTGIMPAAAFSYSRHCITLSNINCYCVFLSVKDLDLVAGTHQKSKHFASVK